MINWNILIIVVFRLICHFWELSQFQNTLIYKINRSYDNLNYYPQTLQAV